MERKHWTLLAVCIGTFMLLIDITIVNVALPDIARSLDASFSELQWVVDAYSLMLAAILLTAGSISDLIGRRQVFSLGLAIFTVASLLCGLAPTAVILDVARAVQGVGGAMMFAASLALLAQEWHGRERGFAFGVWGATIGAAVAVGPLVGGVLTEGIGWEAIFYINIPIGIGALILTQTKLVNVPDPDARGVDWAGVLTFSTALFALVFALIRGNAEGWGSPLIVGLFVVADLLLMVFIYVEYRQERPMLDLSLFRNRTFVGAAIVGFALSASMFAMFLYLTLYIQNILDYSPLQAGLRFIPLTLVSFFAAPISGRLSERIPVRLLLGGGLVLVGVGLILMHGVKLDSGWTTLLAGFLVGGLGIGMVNPALASTAVGVVAPARAGMASGINNTFRQVGIATGIAALGAVFQSRVQGRAGELLMTKLSYPTGRAHELATLIAGTGAGKAIASAPAAQRGEVARISHQAFILGFNEILLIAAVVALAGAVAGFVLVRQRDILAPQGPPPGAPESAAAPVAV